VEPTPAINNPKAIPRCVALSIPKEVSAGLQRLPGPSRLENPSMNTTRMIKNVDKIPRIDVYERRDNGINTVGINLRTGYFLV
jgi:hypothetical protein